MISSNSRHRDNVVTILLISADQSWETLRDIETMRTTLDIDPGNMDGYLNEFEQAVGPKTLTFMSNAGFDILETLQTSDHELTECDLILIKIVELGFTTREFTSDEMYRMAAQIILKPWLIYLIYTDPGI
jgi:hypothetical protein